MLDKIAHSAAAIAYGALTMIFAYDPYWHIWAAKACAFMGLTCVVYCFYRPSWWAFSLTALCSIFAVSFLVLAQVSRDSPVVIPSPVRGFTHHAGLIRHAFYSLVSSMGFSTLSI
jgi:hypothetical protein